MVAYRRLRIAAVAAAAGLVAVGVHPDAQTRRPMTLLDLAELPRLLVPALSPDGKTLAYLRSHPDLKAGRAVWHVWRQEIAGGAPTQLTFTEAGDIQAPGSVRWSPDGQTLMFAREGQLWLLGTDGGEARQLTRHATNVSFRNAAGAGPAWAPDGSAVYFLAADARTSEERDRDRLNGEVTAYEENIKPRQLWKVIVATGAETQITTGATSILEFRLSRDGKRIALQKAPSALVGEAWRGEVWVMDASGENARALTHNEIEESSPELSPDNSQVLFLADTNEKFEPYYNTNLFVMPSAGGAPRALLPDFQYAIDQATWAPDGKSIYAIVNMGVHAEVFQIDVASRKPKQLTNGEHFIPPDWSVVPSAGKMVFQLDEPTRFGDVWTLPLSGEATPARVTHVFDRLEKEFALPRQEKVTWKSPDGTTIEGILYYPIDYQAGRKYPLVLQLHGGPTDSDKFGAGPDLIMRYFPVLAAKGYAVLRPNFRGSTGYGNAFYRDVVGHFFHNMQHDVLAGVDHLVRIGVADPDRLIVSGWSAGGHLTNKLITMTDRFKAASSGASLANWTSFYAQTDSRAFRVTWFGGTPWEKNAPIAAFWDNSPLKDVATVKTPTIFFAGDADLRVPMPATVEMWRALKTNGVPTVLYVGPGEGHQWGQLRHLVFKANTELEWFEKYAMGRAYTPEKMP